MLLASYCKESVKNGRLHKLVSSYSYKVIIVQRIDYLRSFGAKSVGRSPYVAIS